MVTAGLVAVIAWALLGGGGGAARRSVSSAPPAPAPAPVTTTTSPAGSNMSVTLSFGGDVHFEGEEAVRLARDPATALQPLSGLFAGSDLAMVNVESAVTSDGGCPQPQAKQYVFHAPASAYTALRDAGITAVTQANNHGEDCGPAGLAQSLEAARSAGFPVLGVGHDADEAFTPYRTTIHGQRIAILAATDVLDTDLAASWTATDNQPGLASAVDPARLVAAVRAARESADTVVVYLHWGTEGQACPNATQPALAAMLVQAGADVVVGTHAHVQLGAGYKGSAFVDYGLGNLAFYDDTAPSNYSGVLQVTVTGHRVDGYTWKPATISAGLPVALSGTAAGAAVDRWNKLRSCTDLTANPA